MSELVKMSEEEMFRVMMKAHWRGQGTARDVSGDQKGHFRFWSEITEPEREGFMAIGRFVEEEVLKHQRRAKRPSWIVRLLRKLKLAATK